MKINITGTIATLNSAKKIRPCLESLAKVCNQIIIIDSLSSDDIETVAEEYDWPLGPQSLFKRLGDVGCLLYTSDAADE